jgi:hypothetical protein
MTRKTVVTVTICSWLPSDKEYAHRAALLLDEHGSLFYDDVSLVQSAHVKTSGDQLVPYLERRMRSTQDSYFTPLEARLTLRAKTREARTRTAATT